MKVMKHPNGDIFLQFPERKNRAGFIEVWSESEGHCEAAIEYVKESKQIKDRALTTRYKKLYVTDYNWKSDGNGGVIVMNGVIPVTNYGKLPKRLIQIIADYFGLSLGGEMSMYTGKQIFKAGIPSNNKGGVINLYITESRAAFNRFVCNYKKGML
jgi:hypothetical protein